jgi:hypothetical protein
MAIKRGEGGPGLWILVALVLAVAGVVWYAAIAVLLVGWLLVWAVGYLVVACMLPFQRTADRRSRIVDSLGATPFERTRRFWLGALTFGIWTKRRPAPARVAPPQPARPRPTRSAWVWVAGIAVATVVIAGIAVSARTNGERNVASSPAKATSPSPSLVVPSLTVPLPHASKHPAKQHHARHTQEPARHQTRPAATVASVCWTGNPLRGVYHPYRLDVLGACRRFTGTVIAVRGESDGDHHVIIRPARGYAGMLVHDNYSEQGGGIVAEIMPGQKLLPPYIGEHVTVVGTWAYDRDHGWNEIHPIWAVDYGQGLVRSLPPIKPVYEPSTGGGGGGGGGSGSGGGCSNPTPGYSPCLEWHGGADYDCAGGNGNGPYYSAPGVTYRVTGSDPYDFDSDGDGFACE